MSAVRLFMDDVRVRARDGVLLAADLYYVDDGRPRPALLMRGPYLRAAARQTLDVTGLVDAGWALVIQDTRGRGDSAGDGAPFVSEAVDGADTVSWCAEQPWCDGQVATCGTSYLGFTQWQSASAGRSALKAIAPVQASASIRDGVFHEGNAFLAAFAAQYGAFMASLDPALTSDERSQVLDLMDDPAALMAIPPAAHPLRRLYPSYDDWLQPEHSEYWSGFDVSPATHPMDVAGYHVAGWYDLFCEDGIRLWKQMREQASSEYARASQRLTIGYWPHGMFLQSLPEVDFGPGSDFNGSGTAGRMYTWLRDAVDHKPVEDGVRAFVMGCNRWWDLPDWPPPSTSVVLYPSSGERGARSSSGDGRLCDQPTAGGFDRFMHDPSDPVPTSGGRLLGLWRPLPGPFDQRDVELRDDVLVYTSAPLAGDLTIAGTVLTHVAFATSGYAADVVVKLVDVHPDNRALNVLDSVVRTSFSPNDPIDLELAMGSVAHTFRGGHRIRLTVASSNAPRVNPNSSTDSALREAASPRSASQTLYHGGRASTRLVLPVVANLDGSSNVPALAGLRNE